MVNLTELPVKLRAFVFHGVDASVKNGSDQATGTCPFCTSPKFFIGLETGEWDCKSCGKRGNVTTFMRQLYQESDKQTNDYKELGKEKKLCYPDSLMAWGAVRSIITGEWMAPGFMIDGKLNQLYRYTTPPGGRKPILQCTPDVNHQIHGMMEFDPSKPDVYICEGFWDGVAFWEVLRAAKKDEAGLTYTANPAASLWAGANVLAAPGSNVFPEHWCQLLAGKRVFLLYDNDHPRKVGERFTDGSGLEGMKRACGVMASCEAEYRPLEVHHIHWGDETWHDPTLPSGADVRDYLVPGGDIRGRVTRLDALLQKLRPVPNEWMVNTGEKKGVDVEPIPCDQWKTLETAWRKAMKWNPGLDRALCVMLSVIASTETAGDQLWAKVIGPASCGKSTLCEAVTVAHKYVKAKSTIRGFHSGFKSEEGKQKDTSLLDSLRNKTLVTKDGDTLLQSPNLGQILAEARDIYDRTSRTHYRNEMGKDYAGINMTWILCGTSSLRSIDSSELGERFLDCVIMKGVNDAQEDEIMDRVAGRVIRNMRAGREGLKTGKGIGDENLLKAYQLTGGYIEHLKQNGDDMLAAIDVSEHAIALTKRLAKFVAFLRARPSERQQEASEREFSTRLLSQLLRLGMCLTIVRGSNTMDGTVMDYVRNVALDTARGTTFDIIEHLFTLGKDGGDPNAMHIHLNMTKDNCNKFLRFMKQLGMIDTFTREVARGLNGRARWRLTDTMEQLWRDVVMEETLTIPEEEQGAE